MSARLGNRLVWWMLAWAAGVALGATWLGMQELRRQKDAFETDARIIHRLLSQRAVQHDAVLATLTLRAEDAAQADDAAWRRLGSVYPQITAVARYTDAAGWVSEATAAISPLAAQARLRDESLRLRQAVLADAALERGHYWVLQAVPGAAFALRIDARLMVPWADWPMPDQGRGSDVRVALRWQGSELVLQPGLDAPPRRTPTPSVTFGFSKSLAAQSQPFDVVVSGAANPWLFPWLKALAVAAAWGALLLGARAWLAQREARERAEALLRMGQIARLNTLGELAAGLAHELNQPLTAVLASTQAASRLLDDDPPDVQTARGAMQQAARQAQRAAEVLARLRTSIGRADPGAGEGVVDLAAAAGKVLYLLEPELGAAGVKAELVATPPSVQPRVRGDAVAVEQIVHNLLTNATQAIRASGVSPGRIVIELSTHAGQGVLRVTDNGPGIAPDLRERIFQPFFTTRGDGLGLGLSLCESLAAGMGGRLELEPAGLTRQGDLNGASFSLSLPLETRA